MNTKNIIHKLFWAPFLLIVLLIPAKNALAAQIGTSSIGVSYNWAGYVTASGTYTSVGATWTIPDVTSTNENFSADATWVGIGGLSTTDLIQAGTQAIIQNGTTTYEAWYELLPAGYIQVPLTVHAGDMMTVSLTKESNGEWNISMTDATTGQNYQTSVVYNSALSSAEWIEEMPSDQRGMVALDNFGAVSFTNGFAIPENGSEETMSGSGAEPMTMITTADQALATPSALGADGTSFTVTRSAIISSTPGITRTRVGTGWTRVGIGIQGYVPLPVSQATQTPPVRTFTNGGRGSLRGRFGSLFGSFSSSGRVVFQLFKNSKFEN